VAKWPDPASKNFRPGSDTDAEFADAAVSIDGFVASASAAVPRRDTPQGVWDGAGEFAKSCSIVTSMLKPRCFTTQTGQRAG
jgi:hypothetical protein